MRFLKVRNMKFSFHEARIFVKFRALLKFLIWNENHLQMVKSDSALHKDLPAYYQSLSQWQRLNSKVFCWNGARGYLHFSLQDNKYLFSLNWVLLFFLVQFHVQYNDRPQDQILHVFHEPLEFRKGRPLIFAKFSFAEKNEVKAGNFIIIWKNIAKLLLCI